MVYGSRVKSKKNTDSRSCWGVGAAARMRHKGLCRMAAMTAIPAEKKKLPNRGKMY